MRYSFRKSTHGERRLIEITTRAGISTSLVQEPLGQRLEAEQARKEQEERWIPKLKS